MPRRSFGYAKLQALEDERRLGQLEALSGAFDRSHFDPTSEIPGTGPEKMIYNYLVKLGVRFEFQYHMLDLPSTAFPEDIWIPDFQLPDYNILIEVYGAYWHSIPLRREGDQLKKAYWLNSGYSVSEYGIPLYPEGGPSSGKAVIWWDWEITFNLDHLFSRDLPELLSPDRIKGEPEEYILNAEEEKKRMRAQRAAMAVARIRPKVFPETRRQRRVRKRLFDIEKIYPILKTHREYAQPKIKEWWKL